DVKRFVHLANTSVVVNGRLITIDGVKFASEETIFPKIKASLTATIYLSPLSQGATAGAPPAAHATKLAAAPATVPTPAAAPAPPPAPPTPIPPPDAATP